jgi:energy-coupling factor transporter ATP-binding protein EcfA2
MVRMRMAGVDASRPAILWRWATPPFAIFAGVLLLITGASGAGKSTVRAVIEPELSPTVECVELSHLKPTPAVPTLVWRQQATEAVVRQAVELQARGRHLLLSGDPVAAAEVAAAPSATGLDAIAVCLLDLSPDAQATRLNARGDDPRLLPDHQAFADWMRHQATDPLHMTHVLSDRGWAEMRWERLERLAPVWRMHTIDATQMTRTDVAEAVLAWCRRALKGRAPTLQITGT